MILGLLGIAVLAMLPSTAIFTIIILLSMLWGILPTTWLGCLALGATLALVNFAVSVLSQMGLVKQLGFSNFSAV